MAIIRDAEKKDLENINTILEINEQLSDVTEDDIKDSLKWLGIEPDEGPDQVGEYGPYHQSNELRYTRNMLTAW